jgi:hypothetical protein
MKMKLFTLLALGALFLTSCEKDFSEENGTPDGTVIPGGTTGTGGGTGTNFNGCKDCTYYPICSGSVYNYSDTSNGSTTGVSNSFTLTYVKDTTIESKTYRKMTGAGQQNTYFNCIAGVSTTIVLNGVTQGGTTLPYVKITTLKANEPVGASYSDIINNQGQDATFTYTIVSKGTPRTVAGITYPDVIHVHEQTTIDFLGTIIPAGQSEYYFAKGIGLIESLSIDDFTGNVLLHHVLISATIP